MKKIVADSKIPFLKGVLEPYFDVEYIAADKICRNDVAKCDALLVRTRTRCNSELLEGSSVKLIATATIGFDHIDTKYCESKAIKVTTSAGCNATAVVQYVLAALAALNKKPESTTLGIVGCGNVGSLLAKLAGEMGFKVLCNDPPKSLSYGVDLDCLLENSDVISLHVPYTKDGIYKTESLADSHFFSKIKHGAVFINSSRGEIVDQNSLKTSIASGIISRAVIDVWRDEPLIDRELLEKAYIATAHIAGYSRKGKERATEMIVQSVGEYFDIKELRGWTLGSQHPPKIELNWQRITEMMPKYFDIISQSYDLKHNIDDFELIRSNYLFREEFF
ncbi:MAG: 4-phosphoerythronate dehydrogenase [Rikenellaceae bacterium]